MRGGNRDAASRESANQVYCEVRARALDALILVGRAYEQIARRVDRKKFSQVGRSVALLHAGSVPPPYVLVGASGLGGSDPSPVEQTSGHSGRPPCVQRLQCSGVCREASVRRLPGAMLVDSAHEDHGRYEPRATRAPVNRLPPAIRTVLCAAVPVAAQVGGVRFLLHRSDPRRDAAPGFAVEQAATSRVLSCKPNHLSWLRGAMRGRRARPKRTPRVILAIVH